MFWRRGVDSFITKKRQLNWMFENCDIINKHFHNHQNITQDLTNSTANSIEAKKNLRNQNCVESSPCCARSPHSSIHTIIVCWFLLLKVFLHISLEKAWDELCDIFIRDSLVGCICMSIIYFNMSLSLTILVPNVLVRLEELQQFDKILFCCLLHKHVLVSEFALLISIPRSERYCGGHLDLD